MQEAKGERQTQTRKGREEKVSPVCSGTPSLTPFRASNVCRVLPKHASDLRCPEANSGSPELIRSPGAGLRRGFQAAPVLAHDLFRMRWRIHPPRHTLDYFLAQRNFTVSDYNAAHEASPGPLGSRSRSSPHHRTFPTLVEALKRTHKVYTPCANVWRLPQGLSGP